MDTNKRHFVLVHGAAHGAWSWYKVATRLKLAGCRVSTVDLAASGINPKRAYEVNSISDYIEPLMDLMAAIPEEDRVVLVGHSMGGLPVAVAMERFPQRIGAAVFVSATMPGPDLTVSDIRQKHPKSVDELADNQLMFDKGPEQPPTSILFGPNFLSSKLYHLSSSEDLNLAMSMVRPFPCFDWARTSAEIVLTKENYGAVRRVFIVIDDDNVSLKETQRWMIEKNPPDDVKEISGSDHMVMFSMPQELVSCLMEIADC